MIRRNECPRMKPSRVRTLESEPRKTDNPAMNGFLAVSVEVGVGVVDLAPCVWQPGKD
jgi:hypothetical protein